MANKFTSMIDFVRWSRYLSILALMIVFSSQVKEHMTYDLLKFPLSIPLLLRSGQSWPYTRLFILLWLHIVPCSQIEKIR